MFIMQPFLFPLVLGDYYFLKKFGLSTSILWEMYVAEFLTKVDKVKFVCSGINTRVSFVAFMQVHVVPAHMFRKVISITKSHCKLGLTGMYFRKRIFANCIFIWYFHNLMDYLAT